MSNQTEEFIAYRKIPRLFRDCIITEKVDGTNASILITEDGRVLAGKRTSWVTPEKDNFGFARWVKEHEDELKTLGPGRYYGEWFGLGINRGYGLQEKRFVLFRQPDNPLPACVGVVPVLYEGLYSDEAVKRALNVLEAHGSAVVPGYDKPEGIVVFHKASGQLFKVTLEDDGRPKGVQNG